MSSAADRSNGIILKNYIYANISLHKLANSYRRLANSR